MTWPPQLLPSLPLSLAQAFARMEGWYAVGQVPNRPQRNSNPGDLEYDAWTQAHGAIGTDGRFAIFPDGDTGMSALESLLASDYALLTIAEGVAKYAPADENNVAVYTAAVCHWTGKQPTDVIGQILA